MFQSQRGDFRFGTIMGVIILALAFIGMLAICSGDNGRDSLGRIQLVSHEYDDRDCEWEGNCGGQEYDQWNNEDRNRNRDRNRGAFSPGPFDDSPVYFDDVCISLDCSGRGDPERRNGEEGGGRDQPVLHASLFPPTPDGIKQFVLSTIQAGIEMGRLFADTTITFVSNLLVGIAAH